MANVMGCAAVETLSLLILVVPSTNPLLLVFPNATIVSIYALLSCTSQFLQANHGENPVIIAGRQAKEAAECHSRGQCF